jgi:hypothetical protein
VNGVFGPYGYDKAIIFIVGKEMRNLIINIVLIVFLVGILPLKLIAFPTVTSTENSNQIKATLFQLSQRKNPKLEVVTTEGKKLKGKLLEFNDETLTIMLKNSSDSVTIAYPQVKQVTGSKLQWIVPLVAVAVGLTVAIIYIKQTK